jgi:hypothetical protein
MFVHTHGKFDKDDSGNNGLRNCEPPPSSCLDLAPCDGPMMHPEQEFQNDDEYQDAVLK